MYNAQQTRTHRSTSLATLMSLVLLIGVVAPSVAAVSDAASETASDAAVIETLRADIAALSERLRHLEEKSESRDRITEQELVVPTPTVPSQSQWAERVNLKGDFRYRHEAFDRTNRRDRHRQRIRARVRSTAVINDQTTVGLGLATGGSDPISTNQTLDDGNSSKPIVIDLAYVNWQSPIDGLKISAGKFKNPIRRIGGHSLMWDGDLNPEGVGFTYTNNKFFINALGSWLEESSGDDDSFLFGIQAGLQQPISDQGTLTLGGGYFNFFDSRGEVPFFDGDPRGNRLDANGNYLSGFELVELFAEYSMQLDSGSSLSLFGDYVHNTAADDYDTGFAVGANYKLPNSLQLGWAYQELEADATLGLFTDSDFIGGGTDGAGHVLSVGYSLSQRIGLTGTLFLNDEGVDLGNDDSYTRLMLDISFKY